MHHDVSTHSQTITRAHEYVLLQQPDVGYQQTLTVWCAICVLGDAQGFELEGGKRSALEMLESVLVKFPDAIIEEYAQLFFVSVAKEMINLQAPALRELAGDVIKVLLERVGVAQQDAMLVMLTAWLTHDNKDVRRVAVQVTGLCVDAFGKKGFARHVSSTVQLIAAVVVECAPPKDSEDSEEESAAPVAWELLYMALVVLAKIYKTFTATLAESIATSSTSGRQTFWALGMSVLQRAADGCVGHARYIVVDGAVQAATEYIGMCGSLLCCFIRVEVGNFAESKLWWRDCSKSDVAISMREQSSSTPCLE